MNTFNLCVAKKSDVQSEWCILVHPYLQKEKLRNKAVYFMRVNGEGVGAESFDTDVAIGEIPVGALDAFRALLAELYVPLLTEQENPGHATSLSTQKILKVDLQHLKQDIPPNQIPVQAAVLQ